MDRWYIRQFIFDLSVALSFLSSHVCVSLSFYLSVSLSLSPSLTLSLSLLPKICKATNVLNQLICDFNYPSASERQLCQSNSQAVL